MTNTTIKNPEDISRLGEGKRPVFLKAGDIIQILKTIREGISDEKNVLQHKNSLLAQMDELINLASRLHYLILLDDSMHLLGRELVGLKKTPHISGESLSQSALRYLINEVAS
ncbi:hypothetical protein EHW64_18220 [Erwinia psidii]|uniref:hypothetical protein n=1 Tax=Erwinia psidii TaxID=69224 RepID=UPI00226B1956|nr:hypothetical protein [Erwinia psidii]MCX8963001.1 hypothetical protein [Erwinia psidii]